MPVTDRQKVITRTLLAWAKSSGIPRANISIESSPAKGEWTGIRIRPSPTPRITDPLVYGHSFAPEIGNLALRCIYGNDSRMAKQNSGGNISPHGMVMTVKQWEEFFERLGYVWDMGVLILPVSKEATRA
jgi:hypothetical protein